MAPAMGESAEANEPEGSRGGGRDDAERDAILAVHLRYLVELVEELNLCPFARRCRETGRLQRPVFDLRTLPPGEPTPEACADVLAEVSRAHPDVEVVLLTFLAPDDHPWRSPDPFEDHVRALRDAYAREHERTGDGPRYYMVAFHPAPRRGDPGRPLTQDSLVPLIRRTPDPIIQCIRADLLDGIRRQAQAAAEARFRAEIARLPPEVRALLAHAVQSDPELSSDIARANFARVGTGEGQAHLERLIHDLAEARRRAGR